MSRRGLCNRLIAAAGSVSDHIIQLTLMTLQLLRGGLTSRSEMILHLAAPEWAWNGPAGSEFTDLPQVSNPNLQEELQLLSVWIFRAVNHEETGSLGCNSPAWVVFVSCERWTCPWVGGERVFSLSSPVDVHLS